MSYFDCLSDHKRSNSSRCDFNHIVSMSRDVWIPTAMCDTLGYFPAAVCMILHSVVINYMTVSLHYLLIPVVSSSQHTKSDKRMQKTLKHFFDHFSSKTSLLRPQNDKLESIPFRTLSHYRLLSLNLSQPLKRGKIYSNRSVASTKSHFQTKRLLWILLGTTSTSQHKTFFRKEEKEMKRGKGYGSLKPAYPKSTRQSFCKETSHSQQLMQAKMALSGVLVWTFNVASREREAVLVVPRPNCLRCLAEVVVIKRVRWQPSAPWRSHVSSAAQLKTQAR